MGWNEKEFYDLMQSRNTKCSKQENWDKDKYNEYAMKSIKTTHSKYRNNKVVIDDITFDSMKEANFYLELKMRVKAKDIKGFELQPKFLLQDSFIKNGEKIRKITYIADFLIYHMNGEKTVVDVKGYETQAFKLKKKLFEAKYSDMKLIII